MKGFLVFLTVALVASASAIPVEEKGVIEDALATIKCLKETVAGVQASINNITGTVGNLNNLVSSNVEKLNACLAIGGSSPSISDQIASAQCVIALGGSIKAEITGLVSQINSDISNLISAGSNIAGCFK